jgi:hypothetical protein
MAGPKTSSEKRHGTFEEAPRGPRREVVARARTRSQPARTKWEFPMMRKLLLALVIAGGLVTMLGAVAYAGHPATPDNNFFPVCNNPSNANGVHTDTGHQGLRGDTGDPGQSGMQGNGTGKDCAPSTAVRPTPTPTPRSSSPAAPSSSSPAAPSAARPSSPSTAAGVGGARVTTPATGAGIAFWLGAALVVSGGAFATAGLVGRSNRRDDDDSGH